MSDTRKRFPQSEITMYGDQLAELVSQLRGAELDAEDVVTLAYYGNGDVRATAPDRDVDITVRCDVNGASDAAG